MDAYKVTVKIEWQIDEAESPGEAFAMAETLMRREHGFDADWWLNIDVRSAFDGGRQRASNFPGTANFGLPDRTVLWFDECFDGMPGLPADIRAAAERIVLSYGIHGTADPGYIANVIARATGRGDGEGNFTEQAA